MSDAEKEFGEWWGKNGNELQRIFGEYGCSREAYLAAHQKQEERVRELDALSQKGAETTIKLAQENHRLLVKLEQAEASNERLREAIEKVSDWKMIDSIKSYLKKALDAEKG